MKDLRNSSYADVRDGMHQTYKVPLLSGATARTFTVDEKEMLRPIAETLAMLDGNAFFTMDCQDGEWYEQYLPEAWSLFESNGGVNGWAGEASWIRDLRNRSPAVVEARKSLKVAIALSSEDKSKKR